MFAVTGSFLDEDDSPGRTSRLKAVMRTHVRGAFRSGNEHACFVRAPRVLLHAIIFPGSAGRPARRP